MDGSYKPPNVFDDSENLYISSTVDKGKRRADGNCVHAPQNAVSDLYLDSFNDTRAWVGFSNSRPTTDVGSYAASIGSSSEDSMDLDDPPIQFTSYSDSESTISRTQSYSKKRDAFQRAENVFDDDDDDDSDSFQSFYESVQSDLQPSLPTDDKVSKIQCNLGECGG